MNTPSAKKELRNFGLTVGSGFIALALVLFFLKRQKYVYFADIGIILVLFAVFLPRWLSPVKKIWFVLGEALGFVVTRVILAVLFYIIVTPISMIARISGKRFLDIEYPSASGSFWNTGKKGRQESKERIERQF